MALCSRLEDASGTGVDAHRTDAAIAAKNPDVVLAAPAAIDGLGTYDATRVLPQRKLRRLREADASLSRMKRGARLDDVRGLRLGGPRPCARLHCECE